MSYPEQNSQEPKVLPGYFSPAEAPPQAPPQTPPVPTPHYQAPHYQGQQMPAPLHPFVPPVMQYGAVDPLSLPYYPATFGQAMGQFFRKYATFSGRASRSEFWWVMLFMAGLFLAGAIVTALTGSDWSAGLYVMFMMATFVPSLALAVRRLHDANFSGGLLWLWLVPYVGFLIVLVMALLPANRQGARFDKVRGGQQPYGPDGSYGPPRY